MLSNYCSNIENGYVPNLGNKSKYVVHYKNLQLYLSVGIKLTKVHRILKFKQFYWLNTYIDFNTDKRKAAANNFEKDENSIYGKAIKNLNKKNKC